jgi:hypothetical protein
MCHSAQRAENLRKNGCRIFNYFVLSQSSLSALLSLSFYSNILHPKFSSLSLSISLSLVVGGWCFYITGSSSVCSFSFHFGGGRPLHKVHFLSFSNLLDISFARFRFSSLKVFQSILSDVLLILWRSCRLVSGSFISIALRGCCPRPSLKASLNS